GIIIEPVELLGGKAISPGSEACFYLDVLSPDKAGDYRLSLLAVDKSMSTSTIYATASLTGTLTRDYSVSCSIKPSESDEKGAKSIINLVVNNNNRQEFMR
ncbi:MAG: hypothetical protein AAB296_01920, partial [Candidatus Desantisbacteria bacterium]